VYGSFASIAATSPSVTSRRVSTRLRAAANCAWIITNVTATGANTHNPNRNDNAPTNTPNAPNKTGT